MLKSGKRTKEWERIKRILKPRFERAGITQCEFRYEGCSPNWFLTWAHADKRRFLNAAQLEHVVALACIHCHQKLEVMPREKMDFEVRWAIAKRVCQPQELG